MLKRIEFNFVVFRWWEKLWHWWWKTFSLLLKTATIQLLCFCVCILSWDTNWHVIKEPYLLSINIGIICVPLFGHGMNLYLFQSKSLCFMHEIHLLTRTFLFSFEHIFQLNIQSIKDCEPMKFHKETGPHYVSWKDTFRISNQKQTNKTK